MAKGKPLSALTEYLPPKKGDLLYLVEQLPGPVYGPGSSKRVLAENAILPTITQITDTITIDLSGYGGDLVILTNHTAAGKELTLTNVLAASRSVRVINTSTSNESIRVTVGTQSYDLALRETLELFSNGTSMINQTPGEQIYSDAEPRTLPSAGQGREILINCQLVGRTGTGKLNYSRIDDSVPEAYIIRSTPTGGVQLYYSDVSGFNESELHLLQTTTTSQFNTWVSNGIGAEVPDEWRDLLALQHRIGAMSSYLVPFAGSEEGEERAFGTHRERVISTNVLLYESNTDQYRRTASKTEITYSGNLYVFTGPNLWPIAAVSGEAYILTSQGGATPVENQWPQNANYVYGQFGLNRRENKAYAVQYYQNSTPGSTGVRVYSTDDYGASFTLEFNQTVNGVLSIQAMIATDDDDIYIIATNTADAGNPQAVNVIKRVSSSWSTNVDAWNGLMSVDESPSRDAYPAQDADGSILFGTDFGRIIATEDNGSSWVARERASTNTVGNGAQVLYRGVYGGSTAIFAVIDSGGAIVVSKDGFRTEGAEIANLPTSGRFGFVGTPDGQLYAGTSDSVSNGARVIRIEDGADTAIFEDGRDDTIIRGIVCDPSRDILYFVAADTYAGGDDNTLRIYHTTYGKDVSNAAVDPIKERVVNGEKQIKTADTAATAAGQDVDYDINPVFGVAKNYVKMLANTRTNNPTDAPLNSWFLDGLNSNALSYKDQFGVVFTFGSGGGGGGNIVTSTGSIIQTNSGGFTLTGSNGYMIPAEWKGDNQKTKLRFYVEPSNPTNNPGVVELAAHDVNGNRLGGCQISYPAAASGFIEGTIDTPFVPDISKLGYLSIIRISGDTPVIRGWQTTQNNTTFFNSAPIGNITPNPTTNQVLHLGAY